VIDPTITPLLSIPKDINEMIIHADKYYVIAYDNVTSIDEDQSDLMCKIVTGLGVSKRMLYTDDDSVIRQLRRCIMINGINIPAEKADIFDRSVIHVADILPDEKRKTDAEITIKMQEDAPKVIRAFLDILVKAMQLYPTIEPKRNNRMADYTRWGCAITQAMGIDQAYFENAYYKNIKTQDDEVVKSNPVADWLIKYLEFNNKTTYDGSSSDIQKDIETFAITEYNKELPRYVDGWPKGSTQFGRKLTEVIPSLKSTGVTIQYVKGTVRRYEIIRTVSKETETGQHTLIEVEDELTDKTLLAMLEKFEENYKEDQQ